MECFSYYVGPLDNFPDKTIVESSYNYEQALIMVVEELEAKFANLNPYMQKMFLQLNDMEKWKAKDFVLEALTRELEGIAREASEVFSQYKIPPRFPGFVMC